MSRMMSDKALAAGAGMVNPGVEVAGVKGLDVKEIVAPDTRAALVAVKSVKVAVPETAAFDVVPPKVQVPCTAAATMVAVLVVALPY